MYCAFENDEFPESEFVRDDEGVLWHEVSPRHTSLGEVPEDDIPGAEDADIDGL